jgi:hypothetical protein
MPHLPDEAEQLLTYLETRNLSPQEGCAVMGMALQSLIADPAEARRFIRLLARQMNVPDELRAIRPRGSR